jgi:hypothetical protein
MNPITVLSKPSKKRKHYTRTENNSSLHDEQTKKAHQGIINPSSHKRLRLDNESVDSDSCPERVRLVLEPIERRLSTKESLKQIFFLAEKLRRHIHRECIMSGGEVEESIDLIQLHCQTLLNSG